MRRVGVLGSCVTREPLILLADRLAVVWYQARTSIPSMGAAPLFLPLSFEPGSMPTFEQRNVQFDLCKTWIANINRDDYDALLIDFIDERFGCALHGGTRFTWSTSFRAATLEPDTSQAIAKIMPHTPEYARLVDENIGFVVDQLGKIDKPIVCNNTYWSFDREDGSPEAKFSDPRFQTMNTVLDGIYAYLRQHTSIVMLDVPRDEIRAGVSHRWGDAPFHYSADTDRRIAERIEALTA